MITVEYAYRNVLGTWIHSETRFSTITKAVKFIKYVIPKSDKMVYMGFTCDSPEETMEMEELL